MPLSFPIAPVENDTFSFSGRSWRYNGIGWVAAGYTPVVEQGPQLINFKSPKSQGWYETLVSAHFDLKPTVFAIDLTVEYGFVAQRRNVKEVEYL